MYNQCKQLTVLHYRKFRKVHHIVITLEQPMADTKNARVPLTKTDCQNALLCARSQKEHLHNITSRVIKALHYSKHTQIFYVGFHQSHYLRSGQVLSQM